MEEQNSSLLTGGSKKKSAAPQLIRYAVFLAVILVVVVGGYRGYLLYLEKKEETARYDTWKEVAALFAKEATPEAPEGVDPFNYGLEEDYAREAVPQGRIIISGNRKGSGEITQAMSISARSGFNNVESLIPMLKTSALVEFKNVYDPDDFFFSTISEPSKEVEVDGFGIHLVDFDSGTVTYLPSAAGAYGRHLSWSNASGLLAFSRLSNTLTEVSDLDSLPVSNWEVAVVNPESGELVVRIPNSIQAKWSPDGTHLLILKADGMYAYAMDSQEEIKVVSAKAGSEFLSNSIFDLAPDGSHLVWAIPGTGLIVMNEITSWDPVTITEIGRISVPNTEYYWPQFSPDGEYYVVQAISVPEEEGALRYDARLEIRPTRNRQIVVSHSLDAFDFSAFFVDAWIAEPSSE